MMMFCMRRAERNAGSGFVALGSEQLQPGSAAAAANKNSSSSANNDSQEPKVSHLVAGDSCVALRNGGDGGFVASGASALVELGAACETCFNAGAGCLADGARARLSAGEELAARSNATVGVLARDGGACEAGARGVAEHNGEAGWVARKAGSALYLSEGCEAEGNGDGFVAVEGGLVVAGPACGATRHERHGFLAQGLGSRLLAGDKCVSSENTLAGFLAHAGGLLTLGVAAEAHKNGRSVLVLGEDAPARCIRPAPLKLQASLHASHNTAAITSRPLPAAGLALPARTARTSRRRSRRWPWTTATPAS